MKQIPSKQGANTCTY